MERNGFDGGMKELDMYLTLADKVVESALALHDECYCYEVDEKTDQAARRLLADIEALKDFTKPADSADNQPLLKFGPGGDYVTEVHEEEV